MPIMDKSIEYKQDVFVSYSSSDLEWIDNELLKRLKNARIRYIEPRDFKEGSLKINEIENAIIHSRRTLLVVTSNYLNDTWNDFANGLAFGYVLQTGKWRVVPVLKEESLHLPPRLFALVPANLSGAGEEEWNRFTANLSSEILSATEKEQPCPPSTVKSTAAEDHTARDGLVLLLELMNRAEVRGPVSEFRVDFQNLGGRIETLDKYKKLHDKFQQLEDQYNVIYHYGKGDSASKVDWEGIEIIQFKLEGMIDDLVRDACDSSFAGADDVWVQRLQRGRSELRLATANQDVGKLKGATRRLSEVLDSVPARINTSMLIVAKDLRLTALERALNSVHEILSDLTPNVTTKNQLTRIDESIKTIDELDQNLRTLLYIHDSLQEIDGELRRVESSLDEDINEVMELWQDLRPKLKLLCADGGFDWAVRLSSAGVELEGSFPADPGLHADHTKIKRAFRFYRSQTTRSFNQVDKDMLKLCNELEVEIGKPLAPLLAMLQEMKENDQ